MRLFCALFFLIMLMFFSLCFLVACLPEEEKAQILSSMNAMTSSSNAIKKEASNDIAESGATQREYNGGSSPSSASSRSSSALNDMAEYFGYSTVEEFNKAASSFAQSASKEMSEIYAAFESEMSKSDNQIISDRPDQVVSVPDTWMDYPDYDSNPDKYAWEDDANTPEFNWDFSGTPYDIEGEGTTGERGDTWSIPEAEIPTFNFEMPTPEFPVGTE